MWGKNIKMAKSATSEIESKSGLPLQVNAHKARSLVFSCVLYLLAFIGAELVTYHVRDYAGLIFYFVILLSLIIDSAASKDESRRGLWLALGLVPITRIAGLAIPLTEISKIFWYLLVALPVLVGVFLISRVLKFSLADIGLNGNRAWIQLLVAISGILLGLADYLILKPEALNSQLSLQSTLAPALILIISTGFIEEMAFRGTIQRTATALNSWGWVYVALLYAGLQIGRGSFLHCLLAFGVGIYYGWIVKKTGSILGVAFSHGLLNILLYLVLPNLF